MSKKSLSDLVVMNVDESYDIGMIEKDLTPSLNVCVEEEIDQVRTWRVLHNVMSSGKCINFPKYLLYNVEIK